MNPKVTFEMEDGRVMRAELYPEYAPKTVASFVDLIQKGFYDGLIFHRIIAGFVIQGGDPEGTGTGGPGYAIEGEFRQNGKDNPLKHERGVLSMARAGDPNSGGSQFFVCHAAAPSLDGGYAGFGKLLDEESLETLDAIATCDTPRGLYTKGIPVADMKDADGNPLRVTSMNQDTPIVAQRMKKVTVDTFGVTYEVHKLPSRR